MNPDPWDFAKKAAEESRARDQAKAEFLAALCIILALVAVALGVLAAGCAEPDRKPTGPPPLWQRSTD